MSWFIPGGVVYKAPCAKGFGRFTKPEPRSVEQFNAAIDRRIGQLGREFREPTRCGDNEIWFDVPGTARIFRIPTSMFR